MAREQHRFDVSYRAATIACDWEQSGEQVRFLVSVWAIFISALVVEPFSHLAVAFAQSVEEAARLNEQAAQLYEQGRYEDAEPLLKRSLAIREQALGPDHPDVAGSLNNLAVLYKAQGRYGEAEPLYERSLAISEKAPHA